ncbi:MAG: hypothetical protein ACK2UO_04815 [Caldilineaceae bacterium]
MLHTAKAANGNMTVEVRTATDLAGFAYPPATDRPRFSAHSITMEHVLYASILAAGLAIRFIGLARMPLNGTEAANSWAAWRVAMAVDGPDTGLPTSVLFLHLQSLIFWLGANGDAAARVVSAAAGALLILVPWLLRALMGRTAALALCAFFALDPWLVALSRTADGAMLSTLLAILLLALLVDLALSHTKQGEEKADDDVQVDGRRRRTTILTALVAGLFVTSGQMAWAFAPVLAAFVALNFSALRRAVSVDGAVIASFVGAFLVGATGWLIDPAGIGLVSASLTEWIDMVVGSEAARTSVVGGLYPAGWSWRALAADQPLVTLLGVGGLLHMTWRRRTAATVSVRWQVLLWGWLGWGLILNALPGRSPFTLVMLALPLLFGAAYALGEVISAAPVGAAWRETITVVGVVLLLLASAGLWVTALVSTPTIDFLVLQAVLLILLLSAAILLFFGIWVGWSYAAWAGVVAFGITLLVFNVGATWRVNHHYDTGRVTGLFSDVGDLGIRQLVADVETLSAHISGDAQEMDVIVEETGVQGPDGSARYDTGRQALLAWYLRNMRRVHWGEPVEGLPESRPRPLVISAQGTEGYPAILSGEDYAGSDYRIRLGLADAGKGSGPVVDDRQGLRARIERLWSQRLQPWFRWAMYRGGGAQTGSEFVTLWAPRQE